jgi:integrative and conjugative element protein (TIGR02256 family)
VHDVAVSDEISGSFGTFKLLIDAGLLKQLREWRVARFPRETGRVLLGYYDLIASTVTVVTALPAPPDSVSTPIGFERGVEGLPEIVREAARRTAEIVGYIGEWHSHPPGHSATPSSHDLRQLIHLARGMAEDGLPAIQLIVGEQNFQVLQMSDIR